MGATGGSGAGATMGTVDLEALQVEHATMAQELTFLREVRWLGLACHDEYVYMCV